MAQYNFTVPNGSGYDVRANINNAVQSLATHFSGATDPATLSPDCSLPYMIWADTGNSLVKQRTADDTAWVTIGTINTDGTFNLYYLPITGGNMSGAINESLVTMASASTMNIGAAIGNYIVVTGTTTITAFDTPQAGTRRKLKFSDTVIVTYNATTMLLPGAANIVAYAGDVLEFTYEGSGVWRCTDIQRYKGFRGARIYNNGSGQSVAASSTVKVALNTITFDTSNFWSATNTRIEIPKGISYVKFICSVQWLTSNDTRGTYLYKNGVAFAATILPPNSTLQQLSTGIIPVSEGDYFELVAANNYTSAQTTVQGASVTFMSMEVVA